MDAIASLYEMFARISPVDWALSATAQAHLDNLTKPLGSLGRLEELARRLYCIGEGRTPLEVVPMRMFTVAGDHGVAAEGVSAFPQEVTGQMVHNFLQGGAAINVLCREAGIDLVVVDAGCACAPFPDNPGLIRCRRGQGTANIAVGPAMSLDDAAKSLLLGIELAELAHKKGFHCLGIGEMGIANSSSATALFAALLDLKVPLIVGPGAGLKQEGVRHKTAIVEQALEVNRQSLQYEGAQRSPEQALQVLAALGGFEIATMAGILLGAARLGLPCLVDGFIATSAFVVARALCPAAADYGILAHSSAEPGYALICKTVQQSPLLQLEMRLGEGTGCALASTLLRAAAAIYNDMATFDAAGVSS